MLTDFLSVSFPVERVKQLVFLVFCIWCGSH